MVVEPPPTIVTKIPETVATSVFELVYVNPPVLLDVGWVNVNTPSPNVLVATEKLVIVGICFTCKVVVIVPDT